MPDKCKVRTEEVRFQNGDITLVGDLYLPTTTGIHPAVVYIHGSGPQSRKDIWGYAGSAKRFATQGVATLVYDKRGVGDSTGNWQEADFFALAEDGLAGLGLLQSRDDIDSRQIGVLGGSQGGWLGPLMASRSDDVAFVISFSGPGVTPHEQNLYSFRNWLPATGIAEEEWPTYVDNYTRLYATVRHYLTTGEDWEAAEREFVGYLIGQGVLSPEEVAAWSEQGGDSESVLRPYVQKMISELDYDPVPALEKVTCPMLAIWGEKDVVVPVEKSVKVFDEALKRAGNEDFTLKVFPNLDHGLQPPPDERRSDNEYDTRFLEAIADWILERVDIAS